MTATRLVIIGGDTTGCRAPESRWSKAICGESSGELFDVVSGFETLKASKNSRPKGS